MKIIRNPDSTERRGIVKQLNSTHNLIITPRTPVHFSHERPKQLFTLVPDISQTRVILARENTLRRDDEIPMVDSSRDSRVSRADGEMTRGMFLALD